MDRGTCDRLTDVVDEDSNLFPSFHQLMAGEFVTETSCSSVAGRLEKSAYFWKMCLQAPAFVLSIIKEGFGLPFGQYQSPCFLINNKSSLERPHFVQRAILELLANCCIQEHSASPFCLNALSVVEGKKLRLVIDSRHINQCLVLPKFKYEDLRSLSEVLDFYLGPQVGLPSF